MCWYNSNPFSILKPYNILFISNLFINDLYTYLLSSFNQIVIMVVFELFIIRKVFILGIRIREYNNVSLIKERSPMATADKNWYPTANSSLFHTVLFFSYTFSKMSLSLYTHEEKQMKDSKASVVIVFSKTFFVINKNKNAL